MRRTTNLLAAQGDVSTSVTAGGTVNTVAKFTGAYTIGDSNITDSGTAVVVGGSVLGTPAGTGTVAGLYIGGTSTGFSQIGASNIGMILGSSNIYDFTTTVFTMSGAVARGSYGLATSPTWSFSADPDTGIWNRAANDLGIAIGGVSTYVFNGSAFGSLPTGLLLTLGNRIFIQDGSATALWFGTSTYDNEVTLGDATHRVSNLATAGMSMREGTNANMGVVTLSGGSGTAIVYTTQFAASTRVFLTHQNAAGTLGTARVTSSSNGVSFTISTGTNDTSVVAWKLVQAT